MGTSKERVNLSAFEDALDKQGIFTNGLRGLPAHREAYFTIADTKKLSDYLQSIKSSYFFHEWVLIRDHFNSIDYLSPMNSLVARMIENEILNG